MYVLNAHKLVAYISKLASNYDAHFNAREVNKRFSAEVNRM